GLNTYFHFLQDILIVKPPKKSPLALRMIVLGVAMICGVYICSVCLKQIGNNTIPRMIKIERTTHSCRRASFSQFENTHLHYPEPTTYSRGECACTPVRFFAILSTQRSGSGWFETLLNSHINISSNGEIFSAKERRSNISSIIQTLDKVYNLDWYSSAAKNECTAAVGFKWMLNQGLIENHEEVVAYFSRRRISAIFLFRRNLLRQLVSLLANNNDRDLKQLNGTHKAHVHSKDEADVLARYKPKLNATSLIPRLKQAEEYVANAIESLKTISHIVIFYEDLINNQTMLMDVLNFMGMPERKLFSRHVKIHRKPLAEQIENWDEVYNVLNGTRYESFLNSDYIM
ncbi:hypothetical protein ACMD2_09876, partial [Ananas comosus]